MYWRVRDFQANVGIVPVSALTGEGVPDLLAVLMGLSQRYMKEAMAIDVDGPGAGTVLEVKEERGFGATVDVVLYDGTVSTADRIVVGGLSEPIETDVRALLQPQPLAEIRTESQFQKVDAATAAAGVKIAAPELQAAVAGAPVRVLRDRPRQDVLDEVTAEIAEIEVETEEDGVVVKADTLGSLEALAAALEEAEIPIVHAEVGDVAPRDVAVASTAADPKHETILAFGVETLPNAGQQATDQSVDIYDSDVIYQLVEEYEDHLAAIEEAQQEQVLDNIRRPARFRLLPDHVFRQSGPAVVGVEVLSGTLERNSPIVIWESDGPARIGLLKSIQDEGADVDQLRAGERAAVSIDGPTVGRQIAEGDELWAQLPEKHAKILEQELRDELPSDEIEALTQYLERKRKTDPFWAK
jgi:translation initiation factor 5B